MKYNKTRLVELRQKLHKFPELSGNEYNTARLIKRVLLKYKPDQIIENLGGNGLAAIFRGKEAGPAVLFRCDMDALPICETNQFRYKSSKGSIAHKCGHDGHMAIMLGVAEAIYNDPPQKGSLILLFQPSEENGQGANNVLNDKKFQSIRPDFVFALHNLPGYAEGSIILRKGVFAAASKGMINRLYGKTSHAGEPENGNSPALAMTDIVRGLTFLPQTDSFEDFTLVTVIHSKLGEIAFGTSPGYAEVMATLRTYSNRDMESLSDKSIKLVNSHGAGYSLRVEINWTEEFPATVNNDEALDAIEQAAKQKKMQTIFIEEPLRWSEDFSNFTLKYPGALFGLGSGINHPQLHNPDYDFPENILDKGIEIYYELYRHYLK
ncbi:MAG: amidohydrolase [Bacteroidota bacterium]